MANLDTENKRRGATGVFHFYIIPPVPDGTLDAADRQQATLIYGGIAAGAAVSYFRRGGLLLRVYRRVEA